MNGAPHLTLPPSNLLQALMLISIGLNSSAFPSIPRRRRTFQMPVFHWQPFAFKTKAMLWVGIPPSTSVNNRIQSHHRHWTVSVRPLRSMSNDSDPHYR
ncbi:hypothetical protein FKP32DRAFT_1329623 [Trametes sanguinea]|nr:hypothetical protein FKP32DRAFT_1329623 [Trametes sanguinea]